jgi:superfamily II DNA or RNA helicase
MIAQHIKKGGKVLVLTDRKKLLHQATSSFHHFGIEPQHITADTKEITNTNCTVAMVETLYRRREAYKAFIESCTMIVIDEAHKTCFEKLFEYFNYNTFVIGATATPFRTGQQSSMDVYYQDIIQDIDTIDLLKIGKLSKCRTFGIDVPLDNVKKTAGDFNGKSLGQMYDENRIYDGVAENYIKHSNNTKAICFASSIQSAERLYAELDMKGINCLIVHSNKSEEWNDYCLETFEQAPSNETLILINVGILTAGYDCPDIQTVILYRATTSLPLFLQMVGRGSRITTNKESFILLDFGNNIKRHNFWESPRIWDLKKKRKAKGVAPIKECPICESFLPASAKECGYCGHEFKETPEEKLTKKIAELKELSRNDILDQDLKDKVLLCKAKVISPFWVLHNIKDIEEARIFCTLMGYKKGFEYANKNRFKVFK